MRLLQSVLATLPQTKKPQRKFITHLLGLVLMLPGHATLNACQARSQAKLHFHFNASMSALTLGKLEARQQSGNAQAGFSMASLKRRAFNQHLLERISQHLAQGHSLEKSSPDYQDLCNYGTITDRAA